MNRVEKEHLESIVMSCSTSPNSPIMEVVGSLQDVVNRTKSILNDGEITIPEEMKEQLESQIKSYEAMIDKYTDLGKRVSESNAKLNEIIMQSMRKASNNVAAAGEVTSRAASAVDGVKGGVKV